MARIELHGIGLEEEFNCKGLSAAEPQRNRMISRKGRQGKYTIPNFAFLASWRDEMRRNPGVETRNRWPNGSLRAGWLRARRRRRRLFGLGLDLEGQARSDHRDRAAG